MIGKTIQAYRSESSAADGFTTVLRDVRDVRDVPYSIISFCGAIKPFRSFERNDCDGFESEDN